MARYNMNRYQYETSPKKLQPEYEPIKKKYPKKSTVSKKTMAAQKQAKVAQAKNIKIMLSILCFIDTPCFFLVFTIIRKLNHK